MKKWKGIMQKYKKEIRRVIGILVLIVAVVGIWGILGGGDSVFIFSDVAKEGEMKLEEAQKRADTENFHFQINANPVFEDGKSEGSLMITNPFDNEYNMQVAIILDDSGKKVYTSEILVPGNRRGYDKLSEELEQGTYSATAVFDILDLESNESIGQVSAALQLTVNK